MSGEGGAADRSFHQGKWEGESDQTVEERVGGGSLGGEGREEQDGRDGGERGRHTGRGKTAQGSTQVGSGSMMSQVLGRWGRDVLPQEERDGAVWGQEVLEGRGRRRGGRLGAVPGHAFVLAQEQR